VLRKNEMQNELQQKTLERIAKLQAMTHEQMKPYVKKMEEWNDVDAEEMFQGVRRKDALTLRMIASTSYEGGSRVYEDNFNIAYEKYFGE